MPTARENRKGDLCVVCGRTNVVAPALITFTLLSPKEYKKESGFTPNGLPPTFHPRNLLIRSEWS